MLAPASLPAQGLLYLYKEACMRRELNLPWIQPRQDEFIHSSPAIMKVIRFTFSQIKFKLEKSELTLNRNQKMITDRLGSEQAARHRRAMFR